MLIPKQINVNKKNTWFAKPTPAMLASPREEIIIVSNVFKNEVSKLCNATGIAIANIC